MNSQSEPVLPENNGKTDDHQRSDLSITAKIAAAKEASARDPKISDLAAFCGLAVRLSRGRKLNRDTARALADEALLLWDACVERIKQRERERMDEMNVTKLMIRERDAVLAALPKPSKFPVPLDEFLRLAVGGRSKGDRMKVFRDFIRWGIQRFRAGKKHREVSEEPLPEITDKDVQGRLDEFQKQGIMKAQYPALLRDLQGFRKEQTSEKMREAANARWARE